MNYCGGVPDNAFIKEPLPRIWGYLKIIFKVDTASLMPQATSLFYLPQSGPITAIARRITRRMQTIM
jgi:hypothetical protein